MLQNLREHAQGWIAGIIAGLLALAFALWGIEYYVSASGGLNAVAKVNGVKITKNQLNSTYQRLRQEVMLKSGVEAVANPALQTQLKQKALRQLINREILAQAAVREGFRISADELNAVIMQIPAFQENGQFSNARYQQTLSALMYTPQEFLTDLQKNLLVIQQQTGITDSDFALPNEVDQAISLIDQKRNVAYFVIPAANFLSTVSVSPEEIEHYYKAHEEEFRTPEKVSIKYITLSAENLKSQIQISDSEVEKFYQENISSFSTPKKWQVAHIIIKVPENADEKTVKNAQMRIEDIEKQIKAGQDFIQLANKNSDDKSSDLSWFSQGQLSPAMSAAMTNLQIGQVSTAFRTPEGFNLVKLIAVQEPKVQALDEVRAKVKATLQQQKLEQLYSDASDKLSNLTYTNPNDLDTAAETLGLPIQVSGLFTREGGKSDITSNPKVIAATFSENVLKQNNNSDPIQVGEGNLVVLRLAQYRPSTIKPLADAKPVIETQIKAEKAKKEAEALGKKIQDLLKNQGNPTQLAQQYRINWHPANMLTRQTPGVDAAIINTAFNAPKPSKQVVTHGIALTNGDYAVVQVDKVVEPNVTLANEQQRKAVRNEIANNLGLLAYDLYMQERIKKAKVKTYEH